MKKIGLIFVVLFAFCLSFVGCSETYRGTDELMAKARMELPISGADTIEMQFAGLCGADHKAIAWFISGNEYQAHYYLPMEVKTASDASEYTFIRTHKPMTDRAADVAIVHWNGGYAFLVNNPQIALVQMTMANGEVIEESVPQNALPHLFFVSFVPSEYTFLDAEGNEVK